MSELRSPRRADWRPALIRIGIFWLAITAALATRVWWFAAAVMAAGLFLLVRWHAGFVGYRCPLCWSRFTCNVWEDFGGVNWFSRSGPIKYLRCPRCHRRAWMTTLVRDPSGAR